MLPAKNYPPANLAKMIKECVVIGRADLGEAIMEAWNRVCDKYPEVHLSWGTATNIGTRSVKKNVFGGIDFHAWLGQASVPVKVATLPKKAKASRAKAA